MLASLALSAMDPGLIVPTLPCGGGGSGGGGAGCGGAEASCVVGMLVPT